jgi:hypothetical protein
MTTARIGLVDNGRSLRLKLASEEGIMFDYSEGPLLIPKVESTDTS